MKDIVTGERFGFERILIQLLIPGLVALGPLIWLFYVEHRDRPVHEIVDFMRANKEVALSLVVIFAIIAGLIIENLGSRWEAHFIDRRNGRRDPNLSHAWDAYLRLKEADSTGKALVVLHGYNSSIVVRMKFELSLAIALLFTLTGLLVLRHYARLHLAPSAFYGTCALLVAGSIYLFWEARTSCSVLHRNRIRMLQALDQAPMDYYTVNTFSNTGTPTYYQLVPAHAYGRHHWRFLLCKEEKEFYLVRAVPKEGADGRRKWWRWLQRERVKANGLMYYHPSVLMAMPAAEAPAADHKAPHGQ